ncbi:sulfatase [Halobaculum sp. MBLA0147]|uniref:sulfatase n=1 Tax=Halobaculum sp. MBLA0147 TaxID=3079934 RepID=UPI00352439D4
MRSPNVLLVVVDSLRADAIRSDDTETPTLDSVAEESVRFDQCITQGVSTAPAMTAMLTGRYPLDYGGHWFLEANQPTFASQFQSAGYTTAAVHSNPYVSSQRNFDRGFDHFEQDVVAFEPDKKLERLPEKFDRLVSRLHRIASKTPYTPAPTVNERILSLVEDLDDSWFLWAQYMDVHGPYLGGERTYRKKIPAELLWRKAAVTSPDEVTEQERRRLERDYYGDIEYFDRHLRELLDGLGRRGELEDTLVIVTADHGDEFHEHGLFGHGNLPYRELTHVPLFMRFPYDSDVPTVTVEELVRSVDILPTVLDHINAQLDPTMRERCEGQSLLPTTRGETVDIQYSVTEKRVRDEDALRIGFREPGWSFLYDGKNEETKLFDLDKDPNEQRDVATEHPSVLERFESRLRVRIEHIEETSDNVETPDVSTDAGVEERLKALGYR